MIGIHAYIRELAWLIIPALATLAAIWFRLKGSPKVPIVVIIVFPAILCIQIAILGRQLFAIHSLQHLSPSRVRWISYQNVYFRDPAEISSITNSLSEPVFYSSRKSDFADYEPLLIHFADGSEWSLVVGNSRYISGTIMQLSPRNFSSGYAFNPELLHVLTGLRQSHG